MKRAGSWNRLVTTAMPLYAAYVLILVLGLRKGEVLGLTWDRVDLDAAELYVGEQLQRVSRPAHPPPGQDRDHPKRRCRCPTCASPR